MGALGAALVVAACSGGGGGADDGGCVTVLGQGCSEPPDGGAASPPYASVQELCGDLDRAWCAYLVRCGALPSGVACEQHLARAFPECSNDFAVAVESGRATFDGAKARQCTTELSSTLRCDFYRSYFEEVPSCAAAVVGTVGISGACRTHTECQDSLYCTGVASSSCSGICATRKQVGQTAASNRECAEGLYRYGGDGTCRALVQPGDSCAPLSNQFQQSCISNFTCEGNPQKCAPARRTGAGCNGTGDCAQFFSCSATTSTCVSLSGVGGPCEDGRDCQWNAWCDEAAGVCKATRPAGETCANAWDACQGATYCGAAMTCAPYGELGEACTSDYVCESRVCASGVCAAAKCP